jgi:hypothetical protein
MTTPFTRNIRFEAAWDRTNPDPKKNYGVHGVHIWFELTRDGKGLTFSISTNWHLPHVKPQWGFPKDDLSLRCQYEPMAFGVDYHDTKPHYEGHTCREGCKITGGKCYSDGSGLLGNDFLQTLIEGGDEALWARMEEQFKEWLE